MAGGRIGGNVADIVDTAGVMSDTGAAASEAGADATSISATMEGEINEVTEALATHFTDLADGLRGRISQARQRLAGTDWEGTSQAQATEAETALNADVDNVLGNALTSVAEFKAFMLARANDFVAMVEGDFNTIMGNVDVAYADLGKASQTFAENLQLADESIRFNG